MKAVIRFVCVALVLSLLVPAAAAQALEGQWFKVTGVAQGFSSIDGKTKKVKAKAVHYMFATSGAEGAEGGSYTLFAFARNSEGQWVEVGQLGFLAPIDENEEIYFGELGFLLPPAVDAKGGEGGPPFTFEIEFFGKGTLKEKNGELTKAKITSTGVLSVGNLDESSFFLGGGKVTLVRVPESKLPFDVISR